jgi:hypothetical protein
MANHGADPEGLSGIARDVRYWRDHLPWVRRRAEYARLAWTELDVRRLDERIDGLLEVLAQLCDYSGQFDAADDFRALSSHPPEPDRQLRLIEDQ